MIGNGYRSDTEVFNLPLQIGYFASGLIKLACQFFNTLISSKFGLPQKVVTLGQETGLDLYFIDTFLQSDGHSFPNFHKSNIFFSFHNQQI